MPIRAWLIAPAAAAIQALRRLRVASLERLVREATRERASHDNFSAVAVWLVEPPADLAARIHARVAQEVRPVPWWRQARLAPLAEHGVTYIKPWLPDDLAKHIVYANALSQIAPQLAPHLAPQLAPVLAPQNPLSK